MNYYVYIIRCESRGLLYKGYTSYPELRLKEHNQGQSQYTSGKGPWRMVYLEKMPDKRSALIREKQLKRANAKYIGWLLTDERNIAGRYFTDNEDLN